jgi:flagellar basal-body rod modification protein FlgD
MSTIAPATSADTTAQTGTSQGTAPNTNVDENTFLQLMMAELQNQDPMNPNTSDPTQFVSQLAQFTTLEQETNTAQSTEATALEQETMSAVALLGHTISYTDANGDTHTGTVQQVQITSSGPTLTVSGTPGIPASNVTEVS